MLFLHSQFSSVAQSCPTLCDPMDCSTKGFPVHHQLQELAQNHVHRVGDAIQPSNPLLSPSPPAFNLSKHQFSQFSSVSSTQASLSITNSRSLLKLMSIESVMPSNLLILCHSLLLLPSMFPRNQGLFQRVSSSHQVAKVLEFQLQHQSFQ